MHARLRRLTGCAVPTAVACALLSPVVPPPASAASAPDVRWSDHVVVAGDPVKARVDRSSRPDGTRLVLQRSYPDGWRTADGEAERTDRGFVLEVPTDQFGRFTYRVVAKDGADVVARSDDTRITVRPPYDPLGRRRQHVFAGEPRVRWDSCERIRWAFNRKHAPAKALRQVREGIHRIRLATGLDFVYAGRTRQDPNPYGNHIKGADVIIGWRTTKDFRPFRRHQGTVGLGGNKYFTGYQEADGTRVSKAVQGGVVLNASLADRVSNGYGKGYTWGEVIIHELGHVVGLTHAESVKQIMFYSVTHRDADWGAGDLGGFRRLGAARGCLERAPAKSKVRPGRSELDLMD